MAQKTFKLTKQTKHILIGVAILILVIYLWKKDKTQKEQNEINAGTGADGTPKSTSTTSSIPEWQKKYNALPALGGDATLKTGVKAREVWSMQYFYNERIAVKEGKSKIAVDGIFGSQTQSALDYVTFKKRSSITLTGWDWITKLSKQERYAHFFPSTPTATSGTYNPFPAESTGVYNPYKF